MRCVELRVRRALECNVERLAVRLVEQVADAWALPPFVLVGQGFGAALGVRTPITSPTFTLHHRYQGRLVMHHLDVYRLDRLSEVADLSLAELLEESGTGKGGVVLVEWGDVALDALPSRLIVVAIALEPAGDDDERSLTITTRGDWGARGAAILAVDA